MNRWQRWRRFFLVWLGSSLLIAGYVSLALFLGGTPNWLDVLVVAGWAALVSRWLPPLAKGLDRHRAVRWTVIALPLLTLLLVALPWVLPIPVDGGLWRTNDTGGYTLTFSDVTPGKIFSTIPQTLYVAEAVAAGMVNAYQQDTATIAIYFQAAGLALALGLGLTAMAVSGRMTAEAMHRFGAQKNRHFFLLERRDYVASLTDKGGKSWDVEIEDMLPQALIEAFVRQHPDAVEERFQRREVVKFVVSGKPVERDGQIYDYKMMLTEYTRQHATLDDLEMLVELLKKARKCMGIKAQVDNTR